MNNLEKYNIEKETLTIKGLKHNYRIMQISDSHMCFDSELDDEATREKARKMTDIWTSVGNTFSQIENYDKMLLVGKENNCDMFVFAGDIVDFPSKGNLVGLKKKLLESENFIFTLGNHERSAQFDSDFAELMCGSTMIHTKELGEVLFVSFNDASHSVSPEALSELRKILNGERPVILVHHIPLSAPELHNDAVRILKDSHKYYILGYIGERQGVDEYHELLTKEQTSLKACLAGHLHFAHKDTFENGVIQYTSGPCLNGYARIIDIIGE